MVGGLAEAAPESYPFLFLGHKANPYCLRGCPHPTKPLGFLLSQASRGKGEESPGICHLEVSTRVSPGWLRTAEEPTSSTAGPEKQWVGPQGELGPFLNHLQAVGNRTTGPGPAQVNKALQIQSSRDRAHDSCPSVHQE